MVFGQLLFPLYIFQGYEIMKPMSVINIIPKLFVIGIIFILVKGKNDFNLFISLMSLGYIISGIIGLSYVFYRKLVYIKSVSKQDVLEVFSNSKNIFLANSASMLYINTNTFLLGFVASYTSVGYYSVAEKVVRVTRYFVKPLSQALFPHYSEKFSKQTKENSINDIKNLLKKITPFLLLVVLALLLASRYIIIFLNGSYNSEIQMNIYIMCVVIIIGTYNNIIGVLGFLNLNMEDTFKRLLYIVGIFNVVCVYILGILLKDVGAAITFVLSEVLLLFLLFISIKRI